MARVTIKCPICGDIQERVIPLYGRPSECKACHAMTFLPFHMEPNGDVHMPETTPSWKVNSEGGWWEIS